MYNVGSIELHELTALFAKEYELELAEWITELTRRGHRDCFILLNYNFTVILITENYMNNE